MASSDRSPDQRCSSVRQQEVVATLGRQALEADDLEQLLDDATAAVRETLGAQYCTVFETLPESEDLLLSAGVGWQSGVVGSRTIPRDSHVGETLATAEPVIVDDYPAEDRVPMPELFRDCGVTSGVGVVIGASEDPWGILGVHATDCREFTEPEVAFVRSVANVLGSAIETERVTRRLEAETMLKNRIVETSPVGITFIGADGMNVFANDRAEELLGRPLAELRHYDHADDRWNLVDVHGDPLSADELPFSRVQRTGEPVFGEIVGIDHPDGSRVWLSTHCAPLYDAGAFDGAIYVLEDVTEQRRLENELESLFDRITDGVFGLDAEWNVTYVNDRARELIDPEGDGLVGENIWEVFPAAVDSRFEREYRQAMATQEPTTFEAYFPPLSTWFEVNAYPSETGLSVYFRDVTERKRMKRELRETNRTLHRLYEITADSDRTFDEKIDELLELGRERLGLDVGFLARTDERRDRFEVTHSIGDDEQLRPGTSASLSDTYCQRTIRADGLLGFTDDPVAGPIGSDTYRRWELDCYLGGSVFVDDDLYGTLCFGSRSSREAEFTAAEQSFVELATQWVSYELERRHRQRELEESERRYRTLAEHFPNGIVALFDDDLRYTLADGQILDELDISADEFVGRTVQERYDGETLEAFESNFRAALDGEQRTFEFQLHGREWLAYTLPIADNHGSVFAGMIMVQDVTERNARERQLRERESRLERVTAYTDDILDAIDDVFYVLDDEGSLQRWNEALCSVTGYTDDEVDGMSALEFFDGEDRAAIEEAIAEVFETGQARVEATVTTKTGESIPYEFAAAALEDPSGSPVVTGIGRDITDRKATQRRLEQLVTDLAESNERLEQFAYAASHDLQEPLRMISSYLTLLERRYATELDEDAAEFIAFAVNGAERMRDMIDGLLAYSRIDTKGNPFRVVDLEDVLADVRADLEMRIHETDTELEVDSLPRVYGDPGQLRQLFQNLVDNAITYSGEQAPRISVFAEKDDREWVISVRDQGIGIDPDDTDRIFQVFDRLHSIGEYDGTGIGLALCQRIVERHDGEIRVDSQPGVGSTFSVALPTRSATESEAVSESESEYGFARRTDCHSNE
ncbi:PAS domain-containing protein [Halopiger djelfimassiliensis]|uniref:PAS domain-containing protein n=1 Tax=Halopiger djelfimassiliensis TaxID=1293047 RepID=UPI00067800D2|nr:PAS domain-containing protein [Halopiger djelfimassiliensis]